MAKTYQVQLVCHHEDHAPWVLMENLFLSLRGVLNTVWEFDCPVHGLQLHKPLQAEEMKESSAQHANCDVGGCLKMYVGVVDGRSFCRDHFLPLCREQLESYNQRLKEQRWGELSLERVERFIYDCMREADRIEHDERDLDDFQRAQLLNIIFSAAEVGRHLRRSPRKALAISLRLISDKPHNSWEEDTETVLVSRCGALVASKHSVRLNQQLRVRRNDAGQQARARVASCPRNKDARPAMAIEFLDHDNFWGMDWSSIGTNG
jgi:hypothetical protein